MSGGGPPATARSVALRTLLRVESGAYANLVLPLLLERSGLDSRDRAFATELAYGTTRMRRACDWLVDTHLRRPVEPVVRAALRLGAYQLHFLRTPPHAAIDATVQMVPGRCRGVVNAVLRHLSDEGGRPWPDIATELSYPDWIVDLLVAELGADAALGALRAMNRPPSTPERPDGYVQDEASWRVADLVETGERDRVADLCAAPGGKATAIAGARPAALVVASDRHPGRAVGVKTNALRLTLSNVRAVAADARCSPYRPGSFDRVLLDSPCSGLGALRRRPDARWRARARGVRELAQLQREMLAAAATLLRPGATLVYSVCTLTRAETTDVDDWAAEHLPCLEPVPAPAEPWRRSGRGALVLPQDAGTDGMFLLRLRRAPARRAVTGRGQ